MALDKELTAQLAPGEHHTITLTASSHDLAYGEIELEIIVDPDNMMDQMSTTDNRRLISVTNMPSFDMDNSGIVDSGDFARFAMQWQRDDCQEPDWCGGADFDLTGSIGLNELAMLAENWLKEF